MCFASRIQVRIQATPGAFTKCTIIFAFAFQWGGGLDRNPMADSFGFEWRLASEEYAVNTAPQNNSAQALVPPS